MADDASNISKFLNPWLLHHQKLGLELKCPLCLNLLNRPILLPCNHIFCGFCIWSRPTEFGSECSICKQQYTDRDVRPAPYMENLVNTYRSSSLHATFSSTGRVPQQSPASLNTSVDNWLKESIETPQEGNSSNGSLTTTKRVRVPLNHSVEDGNELTGKPDKSKVGGFEMRDGDGMVFHGEVRSNSAGYQGGVGGAEHKEADTDTEGINMNNVFLSSPRPPSFNLEVIDDDCCDPVSSNYIIEKRPAERLVENNSDKAGGETNDRTSHGARENYARDSKRQKKIDHGSFGAGMKSNGCTQSNVFHSGSVATSKVESKFGERSGEEEPKISNSCDANRSICAFCQSSNLTNRTGPMLHYDNGKEVKGDAATNSKVIHVHNTCIEWTPQVYFVGEKVKNLKAEVSRAAKLKCSRCGLRGAALGCFEKSCCKSYHVPCAVEVLDCRWDVEDFLMLCPNHSTVKFPREKPMLGKHASENQHFVATEITLKESNFWGASNNGMKEWVFCGSALSAEEKFLLVKFASICGATVSKMWKPTVTHVIAATDAKGACSRTLKVLMAILNGRWIVKTDWIKACMEAMHPVDEERYEVRLDSHGCCNGPKSGRRRAFDNVPKLFNGLNFYLSGDFKPAYMEELLDLVITAGGIVIDSKEQLFARSHDALATPSVTLVVYKNEYTQEDEGSVVLKRQEVAESLADEIGSQVIAHTWILESIAGCELQSLAC